MIAGDNIEPTRVGRPEALSGGASALLARPGTDPVGESQLACGRLSDASIQAFRGPAGNLRGGLLLHGENPKLRHRRRNRPCDIVDLDAPCPNRIRGRFIYGGPFMEHFGHFMAETIHRIVPSRQLGQNAPWVFVTSVGRRASSSFDRLPAFAREVFSFLEIAPDEFRMVAEDSVVDELFVVEQGSELALGAKPGYLGDLREYTTPRLDALHASESRPAKVYVSRRDCPGNFLGEAYLEEQLRAEGFSIVQPETLPVTVQMDIYRKAEILIFNDGSACHGAELLGAGSLRRCYLLSRRDWNTCFDCVLQPRASAFAKSTGHHFLGTIFAAPMTGEPRLPWGVTLFDVRRLIAFLRDHDVALLPNFDEGAYFREAEAHLQRYCSDAKSSGTGLPDTKAINVFFSAFDTAMASQQT